MHLLIIPSEELVPSYNHTAGIFQWHQAKILKDGGHKVGALSISQSFSLPMLLKAMMYKSVGKKVANQASTLSFPALVKLTYQKAAQPQTFIQKEEREGIPIIRIDGFYFNRPVENKNHFGWIKAGLTAFKEYVRQYGKPDVIHAHNAIYAGMLAQKIKEKYNIPYVLTEHSTAFARKTINDDKILSRVKEAYNKSQSLLAVSDPFCQLLNELFHFNRFQCLPNVLDSLLEAYSYNKYTTQDDPFIFLNIAELHPKKDHHTLISAFKKVHKTNPNAVLWIGGDGVLSDELKTFVESEGLEDSVQFLGLLNRQQVIDYILQSQCFVLSSKYETFGVVVIEAMLFGKPVVVTSCGGPEAFVTKEVGVIVEKENKEQLSEAMQQMLQNYTLYNSELIREYTINHFGKEVFFKRMSTIYEEAV